ncbi:MAG: N-acetylmuramoyl-L-alanine amidase [Fusobacterium sp.]|nr:N-acetylmuramoyl-L-alanine amidase [Fusobacterium sp.]
MNKKVALVIGHNSRSGGAISPYLEQSEYRYFKDVADIVNKLNDNIDIYCREPKSRYTEEMIPVIEELNKRNYSYILELHFNSVQDDTVQGCECLVYHTSTVGQKVAMEFLNSLSETYGIEIRKTPLIKISSSKQQGGFGICKTRDPYILVEPFFGSNKEAEKFKDKEKFAKFLVDFIERS